MAIAETDRSVAQAPVIDLPAVCFFAGVIVCFFGAAMLLPAIVDLAQDDDDYRVFVMCSAITMFGGLSLVLAFRQSRYAVGVREVMLLVPATWIAVVAFSALPFAFSSFPLSYTDAVFEAMSGIAAVDAMGQAARRWQHRRWTAPTDGAPHAEAERLEQIARRL